jgi:hypothetical protein
MLNDEQFQKIKFKRNPTMADVALLIITVEQLNKSIVRSETRLKQALEQVHNLKKRLEWYHRTSIKEIIQN